MVKFWLLSFFLYFCAQLGNNQIKYKTMRNLFTALAIGFVMLFASCEPTSQTGSYQHLFLESSREVNVKAEGESVTIMYTLADPIEGQEVIAEVTQGEEMIANISYPTTGIIRVEVAKNSTAQKREAYIKLSYHKETTSIIIYQAANGSGNSSNADVEFSASYINGYYYGEKYGAGADRYAFFLSDQGLNNGGQAYTNGTYYYIDCFSPANKSLTLPLGTYTFDKSNTGKPFTINSENSQLIITGESVESTEAKYMTDAKMVVTANKVVLEATIDGQLHKVTFYGSLELEDVSGENPDNGEDNKDDITDGQDGQAQSTLEGDRHVTFDGEHRAKWGYEGDYWNTGYSNYTIYLMNKSGGYVYGDTLQFDLITDNNSTNGQFAGKYTISDTPGKMVMMAGFTNKYAQAVGSWFYEYGGGSASGYKNYAMIKSGSAEFIDNGNGTYTVKLDGYDYKGNNITCNWTGVIEED